MLNLCKSFARCRGPCRNQKVDRSFLEKVVLNSRCIVFVHNRSTPAPIITVYSATSTFLRVLAMNSNNPAIGALILVPIVIAASAAFIAIKASEFCKRAGRSIKNFWNNNYPWSSTKQSDRKRKIRRSNLRSSQLYADSWIDLESIDSREGYSRFINQEPSRRGKSFSEGDKAEAYGDTAQRIWHPSRSARLAWSFANPRSPSHNHFESSNVVKPSPTARRPERLSLEDADRLAGRTRAREVRRREPTDL